ncbi:MAG: HEPN domain-containing protein [Oscillospiraceae bacterium]|nr:HEPN domain-containing protein [Oscillospiraceae bacterium]
MIRNKTLIYQAKSFYNAYIALEQIYQSSVQPFLYYVPMIVNGAFSIEITIKAMLVENQIEYSKEHNLVVLFQKLPDSFQEELLKHLFEKAPEYREMDKCVEELILISNAFVDWRYVFEGNPAPAFDTRFISAFANASIWTMLSHYNVDVIPSTEKGTTAEEIEKMIQKNREDCKVANIEWIKRTKLKNR